MSEYLAFSKSGQWELHKATNDHTSDQTPPKSPNPGKPYQVFRGATLNGDLHQDNGTKGSLRDFNGGARPKENKVNFKNADKLSHPLDSVYEERNPGDGID